MTTRFLPVYMYNTMYSTIYQVFCAAIQFLSKLRNALGKAVLLELPTETFSTTCILDTKSLGMMSANAKPKKAIQQVKINFLLAIVSFQDTVGKCVKDE